MIFTFLTFEYIFEESFCVICNTIIEGNINEHFINAHDNYNDLLGLDIVPEDCKKFPGHDILIHIGMLSCDYEECTECSICTSSYSNYDNFMNSTMSDIYNVLQETCEKEDDIHYPMIINCCKQKICHKCVKKHYSSINDLTCPFCRYNYETKTRKKFYGIKEIDTPSWVLWRRETRIKKNDLNTI